MASFTKKVLGLAGAAITFAGMAFGQSTCTGGAPQTNIIRAEGTAEQVGQLVISCTGSGVAGTGSLQVFVSPSLPVTSRVITAATGETEAVAVIGSTQFLGTVSGSTINFSSLVLPAGSFNITISNVRVNATSLSVGAGVPPAISETAFISGSAGTIVPTVISSQQVAFVQNGLGASAVFTAVGGATAGVTQNFVNCVAQSPGLSGVLRVSENFAQAFKSATGEANQVVVPSATAVISTRIKVSFANVPAGVTILLPLTVTATTPGGTQLTWVTSDTGTTAAASDNNTNGGTIAATSRAVALTSGAGSVTYSVTTQDLNNLDKFDIPVNVVTANNGVTASATPFNVSVSFAPVGTTSVPNFVVGGSTVAIPFSTFSQCSTSLLFPFVTNQLGFDTGLAISNTSTDPFGATKGATPQSGTCSLSFYGSGAPSPATVTTPNVATGTTYAQVLSSLAAGFQGYMIAQCNFQFAHGFAFVTNGVGASGGLSQGYLAGVIPDVNQIKRAANDASKAVAGAGETLGN